MNVFTLYLFSLYGIVVWDSYSTYSACADHKSYFETKFSHLKEDGIPFSAECLVLGKTTQESWELKGADK